IFFENFPAPDPLSGSPSKKAGVRMDRVVVLCLALVGCASGPGDFQLDGPADDSFAVTRVVVHGDGSTVTTHGTTTRGAQLAAAERRWTWEQDVARGVERSAIHYDGHDGHDGHDDELCNRNDLWLFSASNLQGAELCLEGAGDVALAQFALGL